MSAVQIVIVEWMGYPLFRRKVLGENKVKCGLGRILENMDKFRAGIDYECTVVLNTHEEKYKRLSQVLSKIWPINQYFAVNSKEYYENLVNKYPFVKKVVFRKNIQQDIGAYNFGYQHLFEANYSGDILFVNSSASGPSHHGWLKKYRDLFHQETDTGFCGITLNFTCWDGAKDCVSPHVQSFFLYSNMNVLKDVFRGSILEGIPATAIKDELIRNGEVGMSAKLLQSGYGIRCSAFPDFYYKIGSDWTIPTVDVRYLKKYRAMANAI